MHDDLTFAPVSTLVDLLAGLEVSSSELVDHYLARIDRFDGRLNSYVHLLADRARAQAAVRDDAAAAGRTAGPLHGLPVSVKELDFLAGAPATMATRAMARNVAAFDSAVVARLVDAGAVVLGKTNAPEFGTLPITEPELFGPCRNPWDLDRSPGGSSGGAAAALAAGLCAAAQASDGGGSIRIPASATGLFGLKPSRFRISNGPLVATMGMDLSTKGALTRTVADAALLLDVVAGYEPGDGAAAPPPREAWQASTGRDPAPQRVGVLRASPVGHFAPPVLAALDAMVTVLAGLGHDLVEVEVDVPDRIVERFELVWAARLAANPVPRDLLEPLNGWIADRGRAIDGGALFAAEFELSMFCRELGARFHTDFDLLTYPVLTDLPPRVGAYAGRGHAEVWSEITELVGATPIVNALGQPSASIPIHWDPGSGLPVGVQIVAPYGDETTLLQVCRQVEEARPWAHRRPPAFAAA